MNPRKIYSLFTGLFFIVGAILFAVGVWLLLHPHTNYVDTTATITDVEERIHYDNDDTEVHRNVYFVDYEVNGVSYQHVELDTSSSLWKVGKELTISYDPSDPTKMEVKGSTRMAGIALTATGIILAVAMYFVRATLFKGTQTPSEPDSDHSDDSYDITYTE
ncbi:MAG: DUF3592 domain-containing protein [Lachnospiraceae bacterium]|nr:DUF3592 domain-containing protein [Lachnospiraceae bacterium]